MRMYTAMAIEISVKTMKPVAFMEESESSGFSTCSDGNGSCVTVSFSSSFICGLKYFSLLL